MDRDEVFPRRFRSVERTRQALNISPETVTRLFNDFKKKQLLQVKGSTIVIKNKAALEETH